MTRKYLEASHIFNLYSTDNVHVSLVFRSLFSFYTKKDKQNKKSEQDHLIKHTYAELFIYLTIPSSQLAGKFSLSYETLKGPKTVLFHFSRMY